MRFMFLTALLADTAHAQAPERWTPAHANSWYAAQPWPVGTNHIPASAINQLEMWHADSFDPARIDVELGWAHDKFGMNTARVFESSLVRS